MYQNKASTSRNTKVAALFSGQGSQYVNMFDSVAMYPRPSYENEKKEKDQKDMERLGTALLAQPTTVACSVGTYDIFTKAGFSPDFVAGHSLGEISALYASGALDRETLCNLVW